MYKIDKAINVRKDEALDLTSLREYLNNELKINSEIQIFQFPSGFSNLTYLIKTKQKSFVLRRPPHGVNIKSGHDMKREFKILSQINNHFLKVPEPIIFCSDKSVIGDEFYIMEKVEGVIFRGSNLKLNMPRKNEIYNLVKAFIETFSEIHSLKYKDIGLQNFGKPDGYVKRQIKGWIKRYNNSKTDYYKGIEETIDWLSKNTPSSSSPCLIHNDYKFDNLMFNIETNIKLNAVLDWEMSTIGDPLMDLGTSLGYWIHESDPDIIKKMNFNITHIEGMPTRTELVNMYGELTGRSVRNILFYFIFGLFKISVIVQQIYCRFKKGLTKDIRFSELNKCVELLGIMSLQAIQKRKIDYLF